MNTVGEEGGGGVRAQIPQRREQSTGLFPKAMTCPSAVPPCRGQRPGGPYSFDFKLSTMSIFASLGRMAAITTAVNTMVSAKATAKLTA